jgi:hypothetical protein
MWAEDFADEERAILLRIPTRDLCRDSTSQAGNSLESGGTDGFLQRPEELLATLIAPLSHPRPLSCKPLPKPEVGLMRTLAAVEPKAACP